MPAKKPRRPGRVSKDPENPHLASEDRRDAPPSTAPQVPGADTLTDAEKAYLDFLVDKAIEAALKR